MTQMDYLSVISTLNGCVAQFYAADQYDLATLGSILAKLDELLEEYQISDQFQSMLGSFVADLENAMLSDSPVQILENGPVVISALIQLIPNALGNTPVIDFSLPELTESQRLFAQENIGVEQEKLDMLEDLLLSVEQSGDKESWASIASILHTLKGDFGVLGLTSLVRLVHRVEDSLSGIETEEKQAQIPMLFGFRDLIAGRVKEILRGEYRPCDTGEIEALFSNKIKSQSSVVEQVNIKTMGKILVVDAETDLLMEFITESKEHIVAAESALMELESNPNDRELVDAAFRSCHSVKGVAGFLNLKPVQELAHALESVMDAGRTGRLQFDSTVLTLLLEGFDFLSELITQVEANLPAGKVDVNPETFEVYRKLNHLFDSLPDAKPKKKGTAVNQVAEKTIVQEKPRVEETVAVKEEPITPPATALSMQSEMREVPLQNQKKRSEIADQNQSKVEETVRVSVQRLDRLIDSIGEIVIAQSMLTADPDFVKMKSRSVEQKASQISIVMRQIQEEAMSLRMISLKSTFQKMSRLVRDLSQKMDKPVELIVTGEDTELDKSIIEHIGDPLVHMLRNSLDHGIESQEERVAAGKEPVGTVELRAYHKSGNVVIDIVDDGRGLNKQKLLQKAISNGIANPQHDYSEQEIFQFIFAPGFSTAAEITDISGRGVGMDVVKRNIIGMRGSLEIHSDEGKGICFSVKLPLTMAIIDGMIVYAGGETLIVPTLSIVSTVNPKADQIQTVRGKGEILNLHNQLYRFVRLTDLLGIECERRSATEGIAIILENIMGNRIALWVDGILKKQQVVIKSLGRLFSNYKWISGGAVLGDGKINLILDVNELFQMVEK